MKDHKLAAIVFTDIVGYTRRMEADEEKTMQLLARQREIIFPMVQEFGGEVIKEIGDGLLMMFNSANRAVRFAMAVQEKLKDDELTIRAGIHIGDVIFEGGDVFGSAVNIAARIEPLAVPGGICISEDVRNQIRNQGDIITASIGKKELKGVNEAVEIFCVLSEQSELPQARKPFLTDLWQRRVFQITGLYLALAYLVRLAVAYVVKEYMLSPYIVDLVWYLLIALIPSILLIAYFHGKKDVSKWTRVELIGMPLNFVVAALILFFVFRGKDLGATTTRLTIQNEDGERIEKVVFKNEFRKSILIFNMENVSGDTSLNYLQYGIPAMTEYDLAQDLLITPQNSIRLYTKILDAGYKDAVGLPITLMKRYAEKWHTNYFLFGSLDKKAGEYVLDAKLYDTRLTRMVSEISLSDKSPFRLVDRLSVEIKKDMGLPESHISSTVDLPVTEIFTSSEKALYYFSKASIQDALKNWQGNNRYLNLAIEEDPGFAVAYVFNTISYFNINNFEKARQSLQRAMDLLYKLPERQQFVVKYFNYVLGQEPEKALNIVKMWVELFPDDLMAHSTLAQRYSLRNMYPEAIHEYKEILRIDPEQYVILSTLGDYYLQLGYFDSSLVYYLKYANELPQQADSYRNLGNYYAILGDMELARQNYEKALLMADATEEVPIQIDLGNILLNTGKFDLALEQYQKALENSNNAADSAKAYEAFQHYYFTKGQTKKSLEAFESKLGKYRKLISPKDFLVFRALNIRPYIHAGELDRAVKILEEIATQLEPPLDNVVPFGYMTLYSETGDTARAMQAVSGARTLIEDFGEQVLLARVYYAQGKVREYQGKYPDAIDNYKQYLEILPTSYEVYGDIARCYRLSKDYKVAEEQVQISLKHSPFDPEYNFEAALIFLEKGDRTKGREYLQIATEIWKDADSDYEKARQAREKLASI